MEAGLFHNHTGYLLQSNIYLPCVNMCLAGGTNRGGFECQWKPREKNKGKKTQHIQGVAFPGLLENIIEERGKLYAW